MLVGSVDGLLFNQDRLSVTSGRMADPSRVNEVMVTQSAASAPQADPLRRGGPGSRFPLPIPARPGAAVPNLLPTV